MKLTLDTNCLIDLELGEGAHFHIRRILDLHETRKADIFIPAIGASERLPDRTYAATFQGFQERVNRLSHRHIQLLNPLAYVGVAYFDHAVYGGGSLTELERSIHDVLFPMHDFNWKHAAKRPGMNPGIDAEQDNEEWVKWRNRKCDTLCMWCHIHYGNDIFVSNDRNFHKSSRKPKLIALGAKEILYPSEVEPLILASSARPDI